MTEIVTDHLSSRAPSIESDSSGRPGKRILCIDWEFSQRAGALAVFGYLEYLATGIAQEEERLARRENREPNIGTDASLCDYFDLIGGSGHGGFIALLIGWLGLSIDNARSEYLLFHEFILTNSSKLSTPSFKNGLKDKMQALLRKYNFDHWSPFLHSNSETRCKTLVLGAYLHAAGPEPLRLRAYHTRSPSGYARLHGTSFWEVACMMLVDDPPRRDNRGGGDPIFCRHPDSTFFNPSITIADESLVLWPNGHLASFWSFGSGKCISSRSSDTSRAAAAVSLQKRSGGDGMYFRSEVILETEHDGNTAPEDYEKYIQKLLSASREGIKAQQKDMDLAIRSLLEPAAYRGVSLVKFNGFTPGDEESSFGARSSSSSSAALVNDDEYPLILDEAHQMNIDWSYSVLKLGYPMRNPSVQYMKKRKPIEIGDVGFFNEKDEFIFLFNATVPSTEQDGSDTPPAFVPYSTSGNSVSITTTRRKAHQHLTKGTPLQTKTVNEGSGFGQPFSQSANFGVEFCTQLPSDTQEDGHGLILVCGDSFRTVTLSEDKEQLKKYILNNARNWYRYHHGHSECELLLVTSVHLQGSWGRGAFSRQPSDGSAHWAGSTCEGMNSKTAWTGAWTHERDTSSVFLEDQTDFPISPELRLRKDDTEELDGYNYALFIEAYRIRKRGRMVKLSPDMPPEESRSQKTIQDIKYYSKQLFSPLKRKAAAEPRSQPRSPASSSAVLSGVPEKAEG